MRKARSFIRRTGRRSVVFGLMVAILMIGLVAPASAWTPTHGEGSKPPDNAFNDHGPLKSGRLDIEDDQDYAGTVAEVFKPDQLLRWDDDTNDYHNSLYLHMLGRGEKCQYKGGRVCIKLISTYVKKGTPYSITHWGPAMRIVALNSWHMNNIVDDQQVAETQYTICRAFGDALGMGVGRGHGRDYGTSCMNTHQISSPAFRLTSTDRHYMSWLYPVPGAGTGSSGSSDIVSMLPVGDLRRANRAEFTLAT